jgi:Protein of unknown function (DUF1592)/Protein of unknown function (DUF1588)/Protein of unknown function (DUF1587)/Protein of unknown function (DUF1595)/Protein of unknown function (DUF1585)
MREGTGAFLTRLCSAVLVWSLALGAGGCGGKGGASTTQISSPLCATDPGPAPLRRMTRFEYGRTIAALTGVDPSVAETLPPDEETMDFDDIASAYSVSSLHAADYLQVAEQAAAELVSSGTLLTGYAGCDPTTGDATCLAGFIAAFGLKAWRRPPTADESQAMLAVYTATADPQPADGVTGVVATMLQVPQFIYRPEIADPTATAAPLDGYALGTRLSYLLTGAGPDDQLLSAAAAGSLATEAGLLAETDRLLADPRSADLFVHFANEWWEIEALPTLDKDRTLYRTWTDDTPGALGQETTDFLTDAWQNGPTLNALLTAPVSFMDASLATYYGLPAPAGDGYQRVALDPTRAAGMLTQGSFLAMHAEAQQTSPTLRGRFVRAQLFCTPPPPPPPTVIVSPPVVDPSKSTRERFAEHTTVAFCAQCHDLMDPVGFAFENYDAAGRWRDTDADEPVDATGTLTGTDVDAPLDGVPSLATRLAASAEVATCTATQWFRYAFGRSEQTGADQCAIAALASALTGDHGDFKAMVRTTVRLAGFRNLPAETQP